MQLNQKHNRLDGAVKNLQHAEMHFAGNVDQLKFNDVKSMVAQSNFTELFRSVQVLWCEG